MCARRSLCSEVHSLTKPSGSPACSAISGGGVMGMSTNMAAPRAAMRSPSVGSGPCLRSWEGCGGSLRARGAGVRGG
jgi:hypothetical protein